MSRGRPGALLIPALGLTEALALAAIGWIPGARATPLPALALWAAAFLAYGAAGLAWDRAPASRAAVWGVGLGARALLLPLEPHFSDDVYRYLWDGWVQLAGLNPYLHAPADPALAELRTAWHALVNHPEVPTIYPPAAQAVFFLLAAAGSSILLLKLAWIACDLGTAWIVDRLARRRESAAGPPAGEGGRTAGGGSRALLLYLWCPLLVLEVAWSAHLEPLGLLPMVAAVLLLGSRAERWRGREHVAGALLGLGAAVKLAPAAGLPALARRHGAPAATAGLGVILLFCLPYLSAGERLLEGLGVFADRWEFNPGLWWALAEVAGDRTARILGAAAVAGVALLAAGRRWSVERALFWTIGTALVLSPTLHPWYVLWILPFAALRRSVPWLVFTGLIFLAYWGRTAYLETGAWPQPGGVALLIHLPLLILLALQAGATRGWWRRSPPRTGR